MEKYAQALSQQRYEPLGMVRLSSVLLIGMLITLLAGCSSATNTNKPASTVLTPRATATAFNKPITYVALGASDAVGVGSSEPGSQGYVPLISERLPQGSHTLNLGISGIRLHDALSKELPLALSTSPALITVWLVTNDFVDGVSYQSYISDLNNLLSQLHTKTQARIVMANLPDLTLLPIFSHTAADQKTRLRQRVKQWDQGIAQLATRYDVTLVDLLKDDSEITAHPTYISGDGFHPSAQGYVHLADFFWQAIQKG